jgi:hypothetical protein
MADPYSTLIPQLIGGAVSIAGAVPNKQDRLQRRIAMGGEDPALAAIRRQLATQNAQTAMSVAASQQGVNPALAQRNAQQALAQQQVQTNTELARLGAQSAQQARADDPMGRKISGIAQGAGQLLNVFGTGMAAQNAGMEAGKPDAGVITDPAAKQQALLTQGTAPQAVNPQQAINRQLATPPGESPQGERPPVTSEPTAPPVPPGGSAQGQLQYQQGPGSGEVLDTSFRQGPAPWTSAPASWASPTERPIEAPAGMQPPQPTAALQPPSPTQQPVAQSRPSDMLPPEVTSRPQNAGLLQVYDEAAGRGDETVMGILRDILMVNF